MKSGDAGCLIMRDGLEFFAFFIGKAHEVAIGKSAGLSLDVSALFEEGEEVLAVLEESWVIKDLLTVPRAGEIDF